jgi:hypothetical protein
MFVVGVFMTVAGIALAIGGTRYPPEAQLIVSAAAIALGGTGLVTMLLGWPYGEEPPQHGMASSTARVVDIEEVEGAVPGHHVVEVTFETHPGDGHSYRAKKKFIDDLSRFRKRERLKVFYDPRDPSEIRLI